MNKEFDFVVFGATGFTGKLVCEELQSVNKNLDYKWAVAGRSHNKLEEVLCGMISRNILNEDQKLNVGKVIAGVNDYDSLLSMCKRAKVILDCVGPYRLYGEQVVKACVEGNANFMDISGEPEYLEKMQKKYHELAREKGIFIIGACGFDSIPSDMGAVFSKQQFGGTLNSLECYLK